MSFSVFFLSLGGSFCTKVYRSTDYNALMWVFQQLFEEVQAMKPNSSRSQSSEIFIICLRYTAPRSIDPKLLDPNHVFKEVKDPGLQKVDVLHKKYDKLNKRHRTGYDESLGILLTSKVTVTDFVYSKDAVRLLTDHNEIVFSPACEQFSYHPATTDEIRLCMQDLRVLAKLDFKKLLKWKDMMKDSFPLTKRDPETLASARAARKDSNSNKDLDAELEALSTSFDAAARRESRKLRQKAANERQRQSLGINNNAFADAEDMELFTLGNIQKDSQLDAVHDVDLDDDDDDEDTDHNKAMLSKYYREQEEALEPQRQNDVIFADGGDDALEQELEDHYRRFVTGKRLASEQSMTEDAILLRDQREEGTLEGRTASAKSSRLSRTSDALLAKKNQQDIGHGSLSDELAAYVDILSGKQGGGASKKKQGRNGQPPVAESDDSSDDSDEENADAGGEGVLVSHSTRETIAASTAKWFAHPIFNESILTAGNDSRLSAAAGSMIASMPATDKQKRKEQRKKSTERQARREQRRDLANQTDAENFNFDVVPKVLGSGSGGNDDDDEPRLSKDVLAHRDLIKRGMGNVVDGGGNAVKKRKLSSSGAAASADADDEMEVVSREEASAHTGDDRVYDSDNEEYDSHDRAMTLALGTLMLRRSKQKALVDASYNRFSWNDEKGLPSWFVDDEMKHNKPQLPVPEALMNQIKSRFQLTGTKEIKKVAEARARKKKRAVMKLKAAKKKATMMADNSEMSEKHKLKAIAKAMSSSKEDKRGKVYVVAHSAGTVGTSTGNKGKLKFVDKRMKKDARAMKKITKGKGKRKK